MRTMRFLLLFLLTLPGMLLLHGNVIGHECYVSGTSAECQSRNLTSVPSDLPSSLTSLDLSDNKISRLANGVFDRFRQLVFLSLRKNCRSKCLESYPDSVFSSLQNLTTLDLSQNSEKESFYPDAAMKPLTQLESLTVDLLREPLPESFSALQSLVNLTLRVSKGTDSISNETFCSLADVPLRRLQLTGQYLRSMHRDAFQPVSQQLQELEVVDLPSLSLQDVIAALHVFQGRNMSFIGIELGTSLDYHTDSIGKHVIDTNSSEILSNLNVRKLNLARNALIFFDMNPIYSNSMLKKSLKHFDISGNYLALTPDLPKILGYFTGLEYLDLSTGGVGYVPSSNFQYNQCRDVWNTTFNIPPKLSYLNVSHCILRIGPLNGPVSFRNASHLNVVDISYCGITDIKYLAYGLENVIKLNFSGNDLSTIEPHILDRLENVTHLSMRDTSLDREVVMNSGIRAFQNVKNLKHIDLSENCLSVLPKGIFQNVEEVILSMNYFSSIPLEVDAMPRLVMLDLTFNSIAFLSNEQTEQLDARAHASNRSFHFLLSGNPLSCDCSVLDFVSWLNNTSVRLDRGGNYSCITDGGAFTNTAEVAANLDRKWRQCVGSWWLGVSSAWLVVTLMTLVLAFLLARFWTNVQHVVLRALGFGRPRLTRADYRYDVYVGCSRSDDDIHFTYTTLRHVLESNGFRLYLTDRDSVVGDSHADQLAEAMRESWRSVFVLSPDFLQDEWCDFVAALAMRLVPGRVLLLLLRPVPRADLPPSLLAAIQEQDVFDLSEQQDPHLWQGVLDRLRAD